MEYLRTLSSALSRGVSPLPGYTIGEQVPEYDGRPIWRLHDGVRKDDGAAVSVFVSEPHCPLELAQNMARNLRTLRHPSVLHVCDTAEAGGSVYIAVERVRPLGTLAGAAPEWIGWGVCELAGAVAFVNEQAGAVHGNISPQSIFLTQGGEWRLGGLETLGRPEPGSLLFRYGGQLRGAAEYVAPEARGGWSGITEFPSAADSYSLALVAADAFGSRQLDSKHVPRAMIPFLRRMLSPQPAVRALPAELAAAAGPGGVLSGNSFVRARDALRDFCAAPDAEKEAALVPALADSLPNEFTAHLVVPVLVQALHVKFTGPESVAALDLSARVLLPAIMRRSKSLDDTEWAACVAPAVLRAFSTSFGPMRLALLAHADELAERLNQRQVASAVWPALSAWLDDSIRDVRAAAIHGVRVFAPQFTERTLNNELLRQLAKTQGDMDPALRCETTALIAALTPRLSSTTRASVLVPAFARVLRDGSPRVRRAGVEAFKSALPEFGLETVAAKALPALAPVLIDRAADVRSAAFVVFDAYVALVRTQSAALPTDEAEPPPTPAEPPRSLGSFWASASSATTALGDWALGDDSGTESMPASTELPTQPPVIPGGAPVPAAAPKSPVAPRRATTLATETPATGGMALGKRVPPGRKLADAILRPDSRSSLAYAGGVDDDAWGEWGATEAPAPAPAPAPSESPALASPAPTPPPAGAPASMERMREERRARKAQLRARRI